MKELILNLAQNIKDELIKIRRHIHMNPELGFQEFETSKYIIEKLKELDIEIQTNIAKLGIIGIIRGTIKGGKTIGIRADMDALSIQEENNIPYKSKNNGIMHACGHDAHVAILLGVAKILVQIKDKIKGTIKLFFQPAEEGIGGAKPMVDEGALKNPDVSAVIALHVDDRTNVGLICLKDGSFTASTDEIWIDIIGKGGHAAYPHETIDPIVIASHMVCALQTISSRNTNPVHPVVVTIATFHSGSAFNIIPESARLRGTIRALTPQVREETYESVKKIVTGIAKSFGAKVKTGIIKGFSAGFNDAGLNKLVKESMIELYDESKLQYLDEPSMGAEDFYEFSDSYRLPVTMFWLGIRNELKGVTHLAHSSKFNIDEDALPIGSALLTIIALKYLSKN